MFFDEIRFGDKDPVQHVCFVVHGIGEACDARFRPLVECVEDLRETSRTILQSHFKTHLENEEIQRIVSLHCFSRLKLLECYSPRNSYPFIGMEIFIWK